MMEFVSDDRVRDLAWQMLNNRCVGLPVIKFGDELPKLLSMGSGALIHRNGHDWIATCSHVLDGVQEGTKLMVFFDQVDIKFGDGVEDLCSQIHVHKTEDLAALQLTRQGTERLKYYNKTFITLDDVTLLDPGLPFLVTGYPAELVEGGRTGVSADGFTVEEATLTLIFWEAAYRDESDRDLRLTNRGGYLVKAGGPGPKSAGGMSGGPIWMFRFPEEGRLWSLGDFSLVGLQESEHRGEGWLKSSKISSWCSFVDSLY